MEKYLYSSCSLQLKIPKAIAKEIQSWSVKNIPDSNLYLDPDDVTYGRDTDSHITICFGIDEKDKDEILKKLGKPIVKVTLGSLKYFQTAKYQVLYIDIVPQNNDLQNLFTTIRPFSRKGLKSYTPHCTIAYVLPGFADQILANSSHKHKFSKISLELTELEFVKRDGTKDVVLLGE